MAPSPALGFYRCTAGRGVHHWVYPTCNNQAPPPPFYRWNPGNTLISSHYYY